MLQFEGDKMGEPDGDAATMEAIYGAIDNTVFVRGIKRLIEYVIYISPPFFIRFI
jgi:hypothetical protein